MGIRFLCPNGHKLNVKSFLAGKKAVCPKCGEKVLVPSESLIAASTAGQPDEQEIGANEPVPSNLAGTAVVSAAQPTIAANVPQPQIAQPQFAQVQPGQLLAAVDPIAEAPQAVWYVRPPSGGQFGPAAADVMRGWMAEGRVTAETLVWRSDWPDWKSASVTFPQIAGPVPSVAVPQVAMPQMSAPLMNGPILGAPVQVMPASVSPVMIGQAPMMAPAMPTGIPMGQVFAAPAYVEPAASDYTDPLARTRKRRQKGADATMIVSGILVALVVLLFIVLAVVLSQNSEEPAENRPKPKPKPAASKVEKTKKTAKEPSEVRPLEDEASAKPMPEMEDKDLELPPLPGE